MHRTRLPTHGDEKRSEPAEPEGNARDAEGYYDREQEPRLALTAHVFT